MSEQDENAQLQLAAKRHDILEEKRNVTGRMSETTRFVAFGLLALYYAIRTTGETFGQQLHTNHPCLVTAVGLFGAITILLDYLQYWFGSFAVNEALKRDTADYDEDSFWYVARKWAFTTKQLAAVLGALTLVYLFFIA
jgi:hypothetical protein